MQLCESRSPFPYQSQMTAEIEVFLLGHPSTTRASHNETCHRDWLDRSYVHLYPKTYKDSEEEEMCACSSCQVIFLEIQHLGAEIFSLITNNNYYFSFYWTI